MLTEDITENASQRVFYDLLLRVGAHGKYQYISLLIFTAIHMLTASSLFFNPFLFYQPPYSCPDLPEDKCKSMVCSLPIELRVSFIPVTSPTLIDKFGDFRCQNSNTPTFIQSIIYIAGAIGAISSAYLSSVIRKKLILEVTLIGSIICFFLTLVVDDLTSMTVLLSLNFLFQTANCDLVSCFIPQTVLEQHRGYHVVMIFLSYNVGGVVNGILFKFFDWQSIFVYYFITVTVLTLIGLKWYIKETPFDLITNYTPEQAYQGLHWIAEQNGNADNHEIKVEELRKIRKEYDQILQRKKENNIGLLDLVRFKSLRLNIICCCTLHFFLYYNYCSPALVLSQFSMDIYINAIVFSIAGVVASLICFYAIKDVPRKKLIYYLMVSSLVFLIPLYFTANCTENCDTYEVAETAGIFVFRVLAEIMFSIFLLAQSEIFPTQIRSIAILVSAVTGNTVPTIIPLTEKINQGFKLFLPCSYFLAGLIGAIALSLLPETVGIPPPEIIEQLHIKNIKDS